MSWRAEPRTAFERWNVSAGLGAASEPGAGGAPGLAGRIGGGEQARGGGRPGLASLRLHSPLARSTSVDDSLSATRHPTTVV